MEIQPVAAVEAAALLEQYPEMKERSPVITQPEQAVVYEALCT